MQEIVVPAKLLDTASAARCLALSPSTLEKLRVHGGGPRYLKLGRSVRYLTADLNNWLEHRVRLSTSDAGYGPQAQGRP